VGACALQHVMLLPALEISSACGMAGGCTPEQWRCPYVLAVLPAVMLQFDDSCLLHSRHITDQPITLLRCNHIAGWVLVGILLMLFATGVTYSADS
jgi:hypothetical protein